MFSTVEKFSEWMKIKAPPGIPVPYPLKGFPKTLETAKGLKERGCTGVCIDPEGNLYQTHEIDGFIKFVHEIVDGHRDFGQNMN